ncbi:MAG: type II secretion system F family protein [Rubripirellula sp.]|nr:type II secretion system F family protein [Rubripirellula sp.]
MNELESWFPLTAQLAEKTHHWRITPWWTSESRNCRQRTILQLLAVAHEQQLDPAPLLHNHTKEQAGRYRSRINKFANRVTEGTSVIEAAEQTPGVLDNEAVLALRFGAQTGTLSQIYRDLIKAREIATDQPRKKLQQTFIYGVMTLLVLALTSWFLATFVLPTLRMLLKEMGSDQSTPFLSAFTLPNLIMVHLVDHLQFYMLLGVAIAFACWLTPTRRLINRYAVPKWIKNTAQSQVAEILRLLAISLEAGRPVSSALSTLAHYHYDSQVRQKLLSARNQIEQGVDEWGSLTNVQLLTTAESHALANSSNKLSIIWTLRRLSDWKRSNALNQHEQAVSMVLPAFTIVIAAFVLLLCSSVFGFLAYFIWLLAQ